MASARELKDRIKAVRETKKITGAMYLISSTKLRRAREEYAETKPYFDALRTEAERILRAGGDDPGELYWGAVSAELKEAGKAVYTAFVSGDHHTEAMIITGSFDVNVTELSILADLYRSGKLTQERISVSLTDRGD